MHYTRTEIRARRARRDVHAVNPVQLRLLYTATARQQAEQAQTA